MRRALRPIGVQVGEGGQDVPPMGAWVYPFGIGMPYLKGLRHETSYLIRVLFYFLNAHPIHLFKFVEADEYHRVKTRL